MFQWGMDMFSDIYLSWKSLKPSKSYSLPTRYKPSRNRARKVALSMYTPSPQQIYPLQISQRCSSQCSLSGSSIGLPYASTIPYSHAYANSYIDALARAKFFTDACVDVDNSNVDIEPVYYNSDLENSPKPAEYSIYPIREELYGEI